MHWNQESGPCLYGFQTVDQKEAFLLLLQCSGIGPKLALAALAKLTPSIIIHAIQNDDAKTIASVPGIGQKKAETIIVLLKEKTYSITCAQADQSIAIHSWTTVKEALNSLGYSRNEINAVQKKLQSEEAYNQAPFELLMKKALLLLSKQR